MARASQMLSCFIFNVISSAPVLLPHWFCDTDTPSPLQAILLFYVSSQSCSYITRLDNKRRERAERRTYGLILVHTFTVSFLFYSVLVYSILFFVDMVVFLSPWPQGHLRFRSRCVETDCSTSRPSVKFVSSHSHENRPIVSSCTRPERST